MSTFISKIVNENELPHFSGYTHTIEKNVFRGGCGVYDKHTYNRPVGFVEKWLRISCCVTSILATCPFSIGVMASWGDSNHGCFYETARRNCEDPCNGYMSEERYVYQEEATKKAVEDEFKELGFDPNDAEARKNFMDSQLISIGTGGHQYCLIEGPVSGALYYMFAPYGRREAAIIMSCHNKFTGEKLSTVDALSLINNECQCYSKPYNVSFVPNLHARGAKLDTEKTPLLVREQPREYIIEQTEYS